MNQLRFLALLLILAACKSSTEKADYAGWEAYGGGKKTSTTPP